MSKKANTPKKKANQTTQARRDPVPIGKRLVELLLAMRRICESHEGNRNFPPLLPGWQAQLSSVLRELLQTRWGFRGSLGPNADRQLVDFCAENPHWATANTFQAPLRLLSLIEEIEQAFWDAAERAEIAAWKWESQQNGALPQELHADTTLRLPPRVAAVLADVDLGELGRSVAMQLALLAHENSQSGTTEHRKLRGHARPPTRKPLSPTAALVYEILLELPEHKALTAPRILDEIRQRNSILLVDESTLRGRIRDELLPYGLENEPRIGYFIDPRERLKN